MYFQARQEAQVQKRKALLNSLFEMWDNDGAGYLDLQEVLDVMMKYKDGVEAAAVETGNWHYCILYGMIDR